MSSPSLPHRAARRGGLALLLALLPPALLAAGININFSGTGGRDVTGPAGAVVVSGNYNNLPGTSGTSANLLDDAGAPTTADIAWTANASWFSGNPGVTQDAALLDGYLAVGDEDYGHDIVVSDLPYAAYDVYVYFGNNNTGATGNLRVNGGGTQFFYNTSGLLPTFTGYDRCTGRTSDTSENGNYVVFENVQTSTLVVQQANIDAGPDSGIMGIQIVETTPAPRLTLDRSSYEVTDTIMATFALGPGDANNNIAIVPRGGSPISGVVARLYVGGTSTPTSNPTSGTVGFANAANLFFGWFDVYLLADATGSIVLSGPETYQVGVSDPVPVPVGAGSYASHVPGHEGAGATYEAFLRDFYVVDESTTRPIPTNDWWTDLLISPYAGAMWAYPLVVSADSLGPNIYYPTAFNGGGTEMVLSNPIEIHGEVAPDGDASFELIEGFESGTYPVGWSTTGTAFGSAPSTGPISGQSPVGGWFGAYFANSFHGGDGPTGTLTSPTFTVDRDYLHFLIGGGNHPWSMVAPEVAAVNLIVGGSVVETATGLDSENLQWTQWDVTAYAGQPATLELIDTATGGWGHILADHFFLSDDPSDPATTLGATFTAPDARALTWSDWSVTMRQSHAQTKYIDVTFGHGMPAAWFEVENVTPVLGVDAGATFFDASGAPVALPATTDRLGILHGGRRYGLYLPDDTALEFDTGALKITLPVGEKYFAIAPLTASGDLDLLLPYIYAIPRDTRFDWNYDPLAGEVTTTWSVATEPLKGANTDIVQGWLPHHYRRTTNDLAMNGLEYLTPRGTLKCATGSTFTLVYPFAGMAPHVPAPQPTGQANDYILARMQQELADYAAAPGYGADTYFGGKDLLRASRYMAMAHEMSDASAPALENSLRGALEDWFTYTPGETSHYYAWFPKSSGLVGFNESFGSRQYTDHHFHYGYHVAAAAALGMYDQQFLADYGEMAKLVAKEYANWDREDTRLPFLRTFDIWAGHSLAGGFSSPAGNNQESTGEAINSWAGVFFLGNLLGDADMAAAGAMGYIVESESTLEYWYNIEGDTWSPNYSPNIVGILFDRGPAYATFFSGDPAWIYGIQWLPASPTVMAILARDRAFAESVWQNLLADRAAAMGNADIAGMGASLGNILLGYVMMFDPDFAASELDRLWSINSPVVTDVFTGGISYYFTHTARRLGDVQFDYHMSNPMGTVFHQSSTDVTTYVAYNPEPIAAEVTVFQAGLPIGCFTVAAHSLGSATSLNAACGLAAVDAWKTY